MCPKYLLNFNTFFEKCNTSCSTMVKRVFLKYCMLQFFVSIFSYGVHNNTQKGYVCMTDSLFLPYNKHI